MEEILPPSKISHFEIQKVLDMCNTLNMGTFNPLITLQKRKIVKFKFAQHTSYNGIEKIGLLF